LNFTDKDKRPAKYDRW